MVMTMSEDRPRFVDEEDVDVEMTPGGTWIFSFGSAKYAVEHGPGVALAMDLLGASPAVAMANMGGEIRPEPATPDEMSQHIEDTLDSLADDDEGQDEDDDTGGGTPIEL